MCAAIAGIAVVALASSGGSGARPDDVADAKRSADAFLDRYMDPDGRVVRRDQGGDTVSEGQAYAMLLAAAVGDRERFDRAWDWTRKNLQRDDGSLAFSWRDGRIADAQPASDADLDAARALLVAARRFDEPAYRAEALRIGRTILATQTTRADDRLVLVAGPWARRERMINPSYFSPRAYGELAAASRDGRWARLAVSSVRLSERLLYGEPALPPNWARARGDRVTPVPTPGTGEPPAYGYDAARLPLRLAESCDGDARDLAARSWPFLREQAEDGRVAPVYRLDGAPAAEGEHPLGLAAAAASAQAAGDGDAAHDLLDRADHANRRGPTYYGAAWAALGRVMLTTDLLGDCG
jgi:endoglucanase